MLCERTNLIHTWFGRNTKYTLYQQSDLDPHINLTISLDSGMKTREKRLTSEPVKSFLCSSVVLIGVLEVLELRRVDKVASEEFVGEQLPSKNHHQQARACSNGTGGFNKGWVSSKQLGNKHYCKFLALLKIVLWWKKTKMILRLDRLVQQHYQ